MITFQQFITESIEDKGIFKAIFIVGIPGAGKSYTLTHLHGIVSPKVINTDRAVEFLAKKNNIEINSKTWPVYKDTTKQLTVKSLASYLNGVLPLFIDGTSNDASNVLARAGILESIGYDVGMVFVNTSLDTAISRADERGKKIGRVVDHDFIKNTYKLSEENKQFFKNKFDFFKEIDNNKDSLTNETLLKIFKEVQAFYSAPIINPVGVRLCKKMIDAKQKYLIPEFYSKESLGKKVDAWYRN